MIILLRIKADKKMMIQEVYNKGYAGG